MQGDVSQLAAAQGVVDAAIDADRRLDILVNNAGTTRDALLAVMSEADFDGVLEQNLKSVFNCSKAVVRQMMKQRYGRIVNVTSIAGVVGNAGQTNYSAAKAGIVGFPKAMAKEYRARNSRSMPSRRYVPTDSRAVAAATSRRASSSATALGRWGRADDVAAVIAFSPRRGQRGRRPRAPWTARFERAGASTGPLPALPQRRAAQAEPASNARETSSQPRSPGGTLAARLGRRRARSWRPVAGGARLMTIDRYRKSAHRHRRRAAPTPCARGVTGVAWLESTESPRPPHAQAPGAAKYEARWPSLAKVVAPATATVLLERPTPGASRGRWRSREGRR